MKSTFFHPYFHIFSLKVRSQAGSSSFSPEVGQPGEQGDAVAALQHHRLVQREASDLREVHWACPPWRQCAGSALDLLLIESLYRSIDVGYQIAWAASPCCLSGRVGAHGHQEQLESKARQLETALFRSRPYPQLFNREPGEAGALPDSIYACAGDGGSFG